jgi:hypothetical protein
VKSRDWASEVTGERRVDAGRSRVSMCIFLDLGRQGSSL